MELLAPIGGFDQLRAAIRFGATAVYGGMKEYGLRAFAGNFDKEELKQAVAYAHEHNVLFYVTMNILPTDEDMPGFLQAARNAAEAGVDAAIVSDVGAAAMLHEELPQLDIHISTQANVLNSRTAAHYQKTLGATRIVLSRELSLEDITTLRASIPDHLDLEAFVHGAMCVSYSGRCLLSSAIIGRSGNRGACAQPCRWKYHIMEEKRPGEYYPIDEDASGTYLLSAYDLCMLPHLPKLRDAGIMSLKIEGRMKTAYYVSAVVSAYRRGLDIMETQGDEAFYAAVPELMDEVTKASHRKSNTGFYFGAPEPAAGADGFEQRTEYLADVVIGAKAGERATINLKNRLHVGDEVEALTPRGSFPFVTQQLYLEKSGEAIDAPSVAGTLLQTTFPFDIETGDIIRGEKHKHSRK